MITMDDKARMDRLPAWAQNKIGRLERDLEAARKTLAAGPEDSNVFAEPYSAARRPLGCGTMIQFGTREDPAMFTAEMQDDGALKVLVTKNGHKGDPAILALSSNYFLIKVVDAS
jgi:hypothetical protein